MADSRHTSGTVTVTVSGFDELAEAVRTEGRAAAQGVILLRIRGIVERARPLWPVKTGRSRSALRVSRTPDGVSVDDGAPYASEIRDKDGNLVWDVLIVRPILREADDIAEHAARAVAAVIASGGR